MSTMTPLDRAKAWLKPPFDAETQQAVRDLIDAQPAALHEAFYKDLSFGTGGMRGIMGVGTNRINHYTIGRATQGLADYLKAQFPTADQLRVAIGYDCRHHSKAFGMSCAQILSANGIEALIFESLRPTPELSYAVRHLECQAGIVLTASHNPPDYNGYKVYWEDGGQVVPPHDQGILERIEQRSVSEVKWEGDEALIESIGEAVDEAFIRACLRQTDHGTRAEKDLKIAFTPLHGSSIKIMPQALRAAGFEDLHIVAAQAEPDGDFPTVKSPNPEEPEAMRMALELAEEVGADVVIGTDPDADRMGLGVRDLEGRLRLLNGNQTNALLVSHLLSRRQAQNRLDGKQFIASTLVSSDIFYSLAEAYHTRLKVTLTGFKWIAQAVREAEGDLEFIGGGEESFGFMVGDFVRDKDSVSTTLLACEIAALAKAAGSSLFERLLDLYCKYGLYEERLCTVVKKGAEGAEEIERRMAQFRQEPFQSLDGQAVSRIADYKRRLSYDLVDKTQHPIRDIPTSDVLIYHTEDGSKVAMRPSGTEPKLKFYLSVKAPLDAPEHYEQTRASLDEKLDRMVEEIGIYRI